MMRRLLPWIQALVGISMLGGAAVLYSDQLGLTDIILVHEGFLSLKAPWFDAPLRTPLRAENLWLEIRRLMPIALAACTVLGFAIMVRSRRTVVGFVRCWPRQWQGLVALCFLFGIGAAFLPVGGESPVLAVYFVLATMGFVFFLRGLWGGRNGSTQKKKRSVGSSLVEGLATLAGKPVWILVSAAAFALFAISGTVSIVVFGGLPHIVDGVSHLFQARILAAGQFFLPSHPLREFFDLDTIVNNGRWFSQYTPGHTILLLLGDRIGAPWLVNPILGAFSIPVLYLLGQEAYDRPTALLGVLLAVLSPFIGFVSGEFLSHASAFLFLLLFLLHYLRFSRKGRVANAALAGLFLGLALLSRPLTALAVTIPCAVDSVLFLARSWKSPRAIGTLVLSSVSLTFVALLLAYNWSTTGAFLSFGYAEAVGPGFGWGTSISWARTLGRVQLLNDALLAWPVPSLVLVLAAFLGRRPSREDFLFAGVLFSLLAAHSPVAYQDNEFGPRYLYEASGVLFLLSARGFFNLPECIVRFSPQPPPPTVVRMRAASGMVWAFLFAGAVGWPIRAGFYASDHWKWSRHPDASESVQAAGIRNAVVFVREPERPFGDRWWESVFLENGRSPDSADVIFARDLGERNRDLMEFYPDRRYFIADTTSLTPLNWP